MNDFAQLMHLLLCKKKHEKNPLCLGQTKNCKWYIESNMENTWNLPDHKEWTLKANKFQALAQIEDEGDMTNLLTILTDNINRLNTIIDMYPHMHEAIITIISESTKPRQLELPESTL